MRPTSRRDFLKQTIVAQFRCDRSRPGGQNAGRRRWPTKLEDSTWAGHISLGQGLGLAHLDRALRKERNTDGGSPHHACSRCGAPPRAEERKEVKKRFQDSPVKLLGLGSNQQFDYPDPSELRKAVETVKAFVKLSHDVGGSGVRVKPNDLPKGVAPEKTIEQIGKSVNLVAAYAADYGQQIRLECHGQCAAADHEADHRLRRPFQRGPALELESTGSSGPGPEVQLQPAEKPSWARASRASARLPRLSVSGSDQAPGGDGLRRLGLPGSLRHAVRPYPSLNRATGTAGKDDRQGAGGTARISQTARLTADPGDRQPRERFWSVLPRDGMNRCARPARQPGRTRGLRSLLARDPPVASGRNLRAVASERLTGDYGDSSSSSRTSSRRIVAAMRPSRLPFSIARWPPAVLGVVSTKATSRCHVPGLATS